MARARGRYEDLHQLVEGISVEDVAVMELQTCGPTDQPSAVLARMESYDIDVMPVKEPDGQCIHYLLREDLQRKRESTSTGGVEYRRISVSDLIPGTASLHDALPLLSERFWLLVLEGNGVKGIVTRGDLQKAPMRMYLFGLLSLLETYLLSAIEEVFPLDEWKSLDGYPQKFIRDANKEFRHRTKGGEQPASLCECLYFSGKLAVIRQYPEWYEQFGIDDSELDVSQDSESDRRSNDFLSDLVTLRNNLAHADDLTKGLDGRWNTIFLLVERLDALTEKVEAFVAETAPQ